MSPRTRWIIAAAIGLVSLLLVMAIDLRFALTGVTARILSTIVGTAESLPRTR
jgi:hypothetical protein